MNSDIDNLRLKSNLGKMQRTRRKPNLSMKPGEYFVKGPIPLTWIKQAVLAGGASLAVGIGLYFLSGMRGQKAVSATHDLWRKLGLSRYAAQRGLAALEKAGLVMISRKPGTAPRVTLLPVAAQPRAGSDEVADPLLEELPQSA